MSIRYQQIEELLLQILEQDQQILQRQARRRFALGRALVGRFAFEAPLHSLKATMYVVACGSAAH
jgi:hypothetical protein